MDEEVKLTVFTISEVGWKIRADFSDNDLEGYGTTLSEALEDLSVYVKEREERNGF